MAETLFYVLGIAVVLAALALSIAGLRSEKFPGSKGLMTGLIVGLAALVVATGAFAWIQAEDEQEHREAEEAEEAAAAGEEEAEEPEAPTEEPIGETLSVASPEDGSLVFDPAELTAKAGALTIEYENPSEVPHNIAIDGEEGDQIAQGETGTAGVYPVTAELEVGSYTYYCSIAGHREAGMEGALEIE